MKNTISKILLKLYVLINGDLAKHFKDKGIRYLKEHELPDGYDINPLKSKYSPYFKKWGLEIPLIASDFFGKMSGVKSDTYLTREALFNYIYPYLDRYEFCPAYADKNIEAKVLNIKKVQETVDVKLPIPIVYNMNGIFFDGEDNEISEKQALSLLLSYKEDMIMKPSIGTFGGKGVIKLFQQDGIDESYFTKLFKEYDTDWVIQKVVKQHTDLASFNESSVNTIRIVTYRKPDKTRKVLYAVMRFGGEGSINDNVCGGGGFSILNLDGTFRDRKVYVYKKSKCGLLPDYVVSKIPFFEKVVEAALALHGQMPYFDVMGWDFSITEEGSPVLIEYNIRPGYGLQLGVGPMFSNEDLDEIMRGVIKHKKDYVIRPHVHFLDKQGFDSYWDV